MKFSEIKDNKKINLRNNFLGRNSIYVSIHTFLRKILLSALNFALKLLEYFYIGVIGLTTLWNNYIYSKNNLNFLVYFPSLSQIIFRFQVLVWFRLPRWFQMTSAFQHHPKILKYLFLTFARISRPSGFIWKRHKMKIWCLFWRRKFNNHF